MKHRHLRALFLVLAAMLLIALVEVWDLEQLAGSAGRCVVTDSGTCILIQNDTPILLSGGESASARLETGDRIFVIHDGIRETWPAQTTAYLVLKIGDGSVKDIPQAVLDGLIDNGWLSQ